MVSKLERGDEFAFVNVPSLTRSAGEVGRRRFGRRVGGGSEPSAFGCYGIRTASMTWTTPLRAWTSVATIRAAPIVAR